jgi:hypothetical protein
MWPFRAKKPLQVAPDGDERLRALERDVKDLKLEWESTYDSLLSLSRKLAKRERRALQEGEEPHENGTPSPAQPAGDLPALRAQARAKGWRV